ncbi:insulinase family protein, partial [candidate division GN15 bacterium]|nr:insulinase family protein [candidate division GN15 bacterium]
MKLFSRHSTLLGTFAVLVLALMAGSASAVDVDELDFPELNELKIPEIDKVTLDNGMRLYFVQDDRLPIFRMSVRVNAGSYLESPDQIGLVDLLGTTLRTGGTQKWTGDELDEVLESVGATVETGGGLTTCNATVNVLSDQIDLGLDVLSQVLRFPVFDQEKIDLAKVQMRSGISRRNDEPMGIAVREFKKAVYGSESPYARHTEYKTVNAVEREDLLAFHDAYFRPNYVQMAIWGDYDKDLVVNKITELFGDWQPGSADVPPPPEVNYTYDNRVHYAEKTDINQATILMGHIGGEITDPDYADRIVMNNVLGGSTLGGRMFNRVRSKEGLAYAAQANYTSGISYPGFFYAFVSTKFETAAKAIRKSIEVVESMQNEPPTDKELALGKDAYLNSFVFKFDTKSEVVNRLMNYDYYSIPDDFLQQQKEKVEKVEADDIIAAAQANLHPE